MVLAAATVAGCRSSHTADPATTFQNIRSDFLQGHLEVADQRAADALKLYSVNNPDWAMRFRLLQAEVLMYEGHRPDVIALLETAGVSYPAAGDSAIKRNLLLGLAHNGLGQAQQADREIQQARQLVDSSNSHLNGEVFRAEALMQLHRNHLAEAADLSRQSLKIARAQRDVFLEATDLTNLGYCALAQEHYDEAVALLNQAADAAKTIQAQMVIQISLENMGKAYFDLGDFDKALASFQQAGQVGAQIGATSSQVDSLWGAGSAYYKLGNLQAAAKYYQDALKGALDLHSLNEIGGIHTELAFLNYQEHQFDAARMHTDEAIRAYRIAGDKDAELDPLFLQALLTAQRTNGRDAEQMFMQVHEQAAQSPSLRWEIENALANFYAGNKQTRQADLWYRKSIHTFEDQRAAVKDVELRLPFFANGDALYRDYADFLIVSKKQQQALLLLDIGRARTLAEVFGHASEESKPSPDRGVDVEAVARRLNATILFYSLGAAKSYLWAITAHDQRLYVLPRRAEIEAYVQAYQKAILRSSDPLREANETAQILYETLVGPAATIIPKGARVFIVPDGALNELNFETLLPTQAGSPHYWIEDVTVSNANSIRMLSRLSTEMDTVSSPGGAKSLLLIGNPVSRGTGYDSLMNAFAEIRGIEKHFAPSSMTVITQSDAVPAAYAENQPDRFAYIHFVAHGTASRLSPLDSAVVLSPPPQDPDNFKLYARDIMRCPLHARLVTISACYGSGLRSYAGEGSVGLSWAFLRAGSHNVIGALWEINDASTPLLMDRLYGEIEAGSDPGAALRAAKLSLIHSPVVYRKPLYWGAFQLYTGS